MHFPQFAEDHAEVLRAVFGAPDWRAVCEDGTVEVARGELRTPPAVANVFALPVEQLKAINGARVQGMIAQGERDEERLLEVLGTWPEQWPEDLPVRLSFLGLTLTFDCDMAPRCVYCNQRPVEQRLGLGEWKRVLESVGCTNGEGPYVYLTGGEPLALGEDLWGAEGLIRAAGEAGAACNLNTNALALTPRVALALVSSGLGRIHISLDTDREEVGDAIYQRPGRWRMALRGLHNLQIAKAVLASEHPLIHVNCVLTRLNAWGFADLIRFLLSMKPLRAEGLCPDLDFHLIPVGGEQNRGLRLSAEEYERFFATVWPDASAVWEAYQAERGVPEGDRKALHESLPYASPYHRVRQGGDLAEWSRRAAEGEPGALAMCRRCYVAPTQGFILPDGAQYWCGGHAVSRPEGVGSVLEASVQGNIRRSIGQVRSLPGAQCRNCPGATQAINQTVEARLRAAIQEWLHPEAQAPPEPVVEAGFE